MVPVRVLLIDDHTLFRESLVRLLEGESGVSVVGHCATLAEGREELARRPVDVLLLDHDLGSESGTDLLKYLQAGGRKTRVLMLTAGMSGGTTLSAMEHGVSGIVLKHSGIRQLLDAIGRVVQGEEWWDTGIVRSVISSARGKTEASRKARELTPRQRTVLRGILDGLANKEIAARLAISETAVKASIQELFSKAGVRTRSQLVRVAIELFSADWLQERG
jgi:DNA-binding NarL/FixJ family response regulator